MARYIKTKKEAIGLSPDAIHFRGEKKTDTVSLRIIDYDPDNLVEADIEFIKDVKPFNDTQTTTWFNIDGLHDEVIMREISEHFELEPLIISDILNTHARPKVHEYDNCLYLSAKMLQYDEERDIITSENLALVIKEHMLLSFQERRGDVFAPIRERIRNKKKRIRSSGTEYLGFALLDIVVDNYIYIISRIGEKIESLDEELLDDPKGDFLEKIKKYKSEISYLRKIIKPLREVIITIAKDDSELVEDEMLIHMKELQNNIELANESVDSYREILSDQLSIFHTTVSNDLNDILKFLTIFSVIFIPITFVAGIYGTNFDYVPELHFKHGYFYMWGIIIVIATGMIGYFKSKKWF